MKPEKPKKRGSIWHLIGLLAVLAILGYLAPPLVAIYLGVVLVAVVVQNAPRKRVEEDKG